MTVILDPGNQTESYSDSAVRQWRTTSGLWKTDYGTSQGNLGTCSTNLTAMTNDRNYWKTTVAHDDPNVWTTRYNTGYAAADVAESPRAFDYCKLVPSANFNISGTLALFAFNTAPNNGVACAADTTNRRINITRTGKYALAMLLRCSPTVGGTDVNTDVYLRRNGSLTWPPTAGGVRRDGTSVVAVTVIVDMSAGEYIDGYGQVSGGTPVACGTQSYIEATFIPTPANPQ